MESSLTDERKKTMLDHPPLDKALEVLKSGISKRKTVILVGSCSVNYEGRASSKLENGERIVLLKSDGSIQVHRPREFAPVNWQPPGSLFRTGIVDDKLNVRAFRKKENEILEISFNNIIMAAAFDLVDSGEFSLYASEEDMKNAILARPSLLEKGFRPITTEKRVRPGFIDILGVDANNVLTIVEIKRKPADREALLQLKRYLDVFKSASDREVRGIITAPELAKGAQKLMASLNLEFKPLDPQTCAEVLKQKRGKQITDFLQF